ncbi:MAG: hypothetical protein WCJ35_26755 [Planctomycetota bacterium]
MIDRIFDLCVDLLVWGAQKFGTTYKRINVYVFCVILPLILLGQTGAIIWLLLHR